MLKISRRTVISQLPTAGVFVFGLILQLSVFSLAQVPTRLPKNGVIVSDVMVKESRHAIRPAAASSPVVSSNSMGPIKTILVIGDSIAEGYGVSKSEAFPERMEEILRGQGHAVKVINGGISGSVTADADHRLKWYLKAKPDILLLELGGNDGLKGTPVSVIKGNLAKVIDLAQKNHILVVLAGMQIYASYGEAYAGAFAKMYRDLAHEKKIKLIPFLLEGVDLKPELNQADLKHPNPKGHDIVAHTVAKFLAPLL